MREINLIVIHCSDTPAGMDIGVKEIDEWHKERGWKSCGYHYVIRRNGVIEKGRPDEEVGAHVEGHNANSIGVCMVGGYHGECNFTQQQWRALENLIMDLTVRGSSPYKNAAVCGHRDLNPAKACPSFDARAWWNFQA